MSTQTEFPQSFIGPWKDLLESHRDQQKDDFPNHHVNNFDSLITLSNPRTLYVGTGHSIYERALLPAILGAKHSVQLVTCYWAASPSLDGIRETLLRLVAARQGGEGTLRIAIGFSSYGLFQKLFHTSSRDGYVYPPSKWPALGLPDEETLRSARIELSVKTLFFTPFSVMHPKFLIVDGARAWVPSCNVSWERWFEGCVEVDGDIVNSLSAFYQRVWATGQDTRLEERVQRGHLDEHGRDVDGHVAGLEQMTSQLPIASTDESATQSFTFTFTFTNPQPVPTIFLPSPHHRNPRFSFFPFLSQSNPPTTPLNAALLTLIANAQRRITILTPNVTAQPVVDALLEALARGVDVQIRTSKGMMLLEQLVTAGTTTAWCLGRFIKKYKQLRARAAQPVDPEAQTVAPGNLEVLYYQPLEARKNQDDEPVVSHFKMTLVDGEYLVLGSGNMDRASWWTSQEIGILFYVPRFEGHRLWDGALEKRTEVLFDSHSR